MDSLLAMVMHDAKNALQAQAHWLRLAGQQAAGLADESAGGGALAESLRQASVINSHLGQRLVELLTLYRAQQGQLHLTMEDHHVAEFMASVAQEYRQTLTPQEQRVQLEVDVREAGDLAWAFDATVVRLVLVDALRNASRHAGSRIRLSARCRAGDGLLLSVEDDGPGYPATCLSGPGAAAAERPVEAGQRASGGEPGAMADHLSTGLGLEFARLIAAHHRAMGGRSGRLELANSGYQAGGACWRLWLP